MLVLLASCSSELEVFLLETGHDYKEQSCPSALKQNVLEKGAFHVNEWAHTDLISHAMWWTEEEKGSGANE